MMDNQEFDAYLARLGLPPAGVRLVEKARLESPVRAVQSHGSNVLCHFQSKKMNRRIELESNGVELPAAVLYEQDKSILEYYAQPTRVDTVITDRGNQRACRLQHTPDFMLLYRHSVVMDEWREELRLQRIAREHPGRYERDERGWHWPEMEAHLSDIGIEYRLRSAQDLPRDFVQNVRFLEDYFDPAIQPLGRGRLDAIKACFQERAFMTLSELIAFGSAQPPQG